MGIDEMRQACEQFLAQARAIRGAFPDAAAMRGVAIDSEPGGDGWPDLRSALRYLRDEMVFVRDGGASGVGVLDDEIAHTEAVLAGR
jgi:hypothetical protein